MAAKGRNQFGSRSIWEISGCKCALVGIGGVRPSMDLASTPLHIVDEVGAEQDPQDWWAAFISAARELIAKLPEEQGEVAVICCSCQGECTVPRG